MCIYHISILQTEHEVADNNMRLEVNKFRILTVTSIMWLGLLDRIILLASLICDLGVKCKVSLHALGYNSGNCNDNQSSNSLYFPSNLPSSLQIVHLEALKKTCCFSTRTSPLPSSIGAHDNSTFNPSFSTNTKNPFFLHRCSIRIDKRGPKCLPLK